MMEWGKRFWVSLKLVTDLRKTSALGLVMSFLVAVGVDSWFSVPLAALYALFFAAGYVKSKEQPAKET